MTCVLEGGGVCHRTDPKGPHTVDWGPQAIYQVMPTSQYSPLNPHLSWTVINRRMELLQWQSRDITIQQQPVGGGGVVVEVVVVVVVAVAVVTVVVAVTVVVVVEQ